MRQSNSFGTIYVAFAVLFGTLVVVKSKDIDIQQIEHIEYCERVEAYEATKHLPEGEIQGHRNFKEIDCNE